MAYHLTTLLRDRDLRALVRLGIRLPQTYTRRFKDRLLGRSDYPASLIFLEIMGNLAGPWSLWRSRRRHQQQGYRAGETTGTRCAKDVQQSSTVRNTEPVGMGEG